MAFVEEANEVTVAALVRASRVVEAWVVKMEAAEALRCSIHCKIRCCCCFANHLHSFRRH